MKGKKKAKHLRARIEEYRDPHPVNNQKCHKPGSQNHKK